jgi:hypothetical protein
VENNSRPLVKNTVHPAVDWLSDIPAAAFRGLCLFRSSQIFPGYLLLAAIRFHQRHLIPDDSPVLIFDYANGAAVGISLAGLNDLNSGFTVYCHRILIGNRSAG